MIDQLVALGLARLQAKATPPSEQALMPVVSLFSTQLVRLPTT